MTKKFVATISIAFLIFTLNVFSMVNEEMILSDTHPEKLSDFGFFSNPQRQLPNTGVLPYSLISPLFTDYADKTRFVYIPQTMRAAYEENEVFNFPIGSVLIKTFSYEAINSDRINLIETRLLLHKKNGWEAITYVWDKEQEEAYLNIAGKTVLTQYLDPSNNLTNLRYRVPNKNQCKECHLKNNSLVPIGPKPRNLNKIHHYSEGPMNQLVKWRAMNLISENIEIPQSISNYSDSEEPLNDRARAYLDINCGHCHSKNGSANTTGLYLNLLENNRKSIGINKPPVAAGRGAGTNKYSIVPGFPDQSILLYRMISNEPDIMMPESGRSIAHQEGIALIREWIDSME
ncbi:MAG: hypothetical protein HOM10_08485 [Gammaproteobacteria bacterium]|jgi:uncharacterized repeat protein (TIGR03806 family)|nr:hypothetical protein [Gammaproteobacteria bacterium]